MNDLSTDAQQLEALLKDLTAKQLEFVECRLLVSSDAEAARTVGVAAGTVSRWKSEGAPLDDILKMARQDSVNVAREQLRRLATKAVRVLEEEMDKKRNPKRLDAAQAVLDRVGLEKSQNVDLTSGGNVLNFIIERDNGTDPAD